MIFFRSFPYNTPNQRFITFLFPRSSIIIMKRALLLLFLLSAVSFAQPFGINDIEKTFYKDILQIYQYPGAPFSGNPFTDIIMIFFIPTGFLVILVYTIAGRFYENPKLRLLLSVMFFLFAVAGGAFRS